MKLSKIDLKKIKSVQSDLTVTSEKCREIYYGFLSEVLKNLNFEPINPKKYEGKNIDEILKVVMETNLTKPNLKEILEVKKFVTMSVALLTDKKGNFWVDHCNTKVYECSDYYIIDKIRVSVDEILKDNFIVYQLSLEECKDILNAEFDYHHTIN